MAYEISLTLLSDATFGRGDGVVGLVDAEIEHDAATGLPFMRARVLKGLLVEECANILHALPATAQARERLERTAELLFGRPGSGEDDDARMRLGPALLARELREAVEADMRAGRLYPTTVLESLTAVRRQTAMTEDGVPADGSLRAMRVLLRQTILTAQVEFDPISESEQADMLALLTACVLSLRRGGTGRNRGRGRLRAEFHGEPNTNQLAHFEQIVREAFGEVKR
jgi:hypothetical protein